MNDGFGTEVGLGLVAVQLIAILLGIVISVCWIILPFAVFGIKKRLDKIVHILENIDLNTVRSTTSRLDENVIVPDSLRDPFR